jgi:hypothetical protein
MAVSLKRPLAEYEQRQAVGFLQEILLNAKKDRQGSGPEIQEMQIYYLLSDLDMLPESYRADWPTEMMR